MVQRTKVKTAKKSAKTSKKQSTNKAKFPQDFLNKIICGDSLAVMRQMPDECLDLVVTSPPYNLKNSTGNGMRDGRGGKWSNAALISGYQDHDDEMPHEEYAKWQKDCSFNPCPNCPRPILWKWDNCRCLPRSKAELYRNRAFSEVCRDVQEKAES